MGMIADRLEHSQSFAENAQSLVVFGRPLHANLVLLVVVSCKPWPCLSIVGIPGIRQSASPEEELNKLAPSGASEHLFPLGNIARSPHRERYSATATHVTYATVACVP
jgi:hypothetical protein